jgi:N-methylhydantoinase B
LARGRIPVGAEALQGAKVEILAAKQRTLLNPDDAIVIVCAGGGGYGDPLERDPVRVLGDVEAGLVSPVVARDVYGVAIVGGADGRAAAIDAASTDALRSALRDRRLSEGRPGPGRREGKGTVPAAAAGTRRIGEALVLVSADGEAYYACRKCSRRICAADQDPKSASLARVVSMEGLSPWNRYRLSDEAVVREFCCPGCAHLLAVEVRKKGDPVLYDTELL